MTPPATLQELKSGITITDDSSSGYEITEEDHKKRKFCEDVGRIRDSIRKVEQNVFSLTKQEDIDKCFSLEWFC